MDAQTPASRPPNPSPRQFDYPTDTVGKALLYALERPADPPERAVFIQPGTGLVRWPIVLIYSAFALASLFSGWHNNDFESWTWFWVLAVISVVFQFLLLLGIWQVHREQARMPNGVDDRTRISVRILRQAALTGDDELAPAVTTSEESQAPPQPDADNAHLTVQPPQSRLQRGERVVWLFCVFAWIFNLVVQLISFDRRSDSWLPPGFYLFLSFLFLSQFILATLKSRAIHVEAREDGLHWGKHAIPWAEVRAWYVLSLNPVNTRTPLPNVVYGVVGQHASLTWLTYPRHVRESEPGQQLANIVQRHVSLPLRDLTPSVIRLSTEAIRRSPWRRSRLLATEDRQPRLPAAAFTFLVSVLVLLAGILTPHAQQWYFGGQAARLEAAPLAVLDPLTTDTLQWSPAPQEALKSFAFTPSGYVFSSPTGYACCDLSSLIPISMSNGLAEVTIHQNVDSDLSQVGIVFRADGNKRTALAFTVTPNGEWRLTQYDLGADGTLDHRYDLHYESNLFGIRSIGSIHQGRNATNRLAVLMQGTSYTFFINGQFVGGYAANDLPLTGRVGVYANSFDGSVTFSDLLISPA